MPFKKQGPDDYTGPSGKHFDLKQVRLYYAHGGSFPGQKHAEGGIVSKFNSKPQDAAYAQGGAVLPRARDFKKEPNKNFMKLQDEFRNRDEVGTGDSANEDQKYAKTGQGAGKGFIKPEAASDKVEKTVKPR